MAQTSSDRDLGHLYPPFRQQVEDVLREMNRYAKIRMGPGWDWRLVEGFRTASYQASLYAKGRTTGKDIVTFADGVKVKSKHQSGCGADLVPFKNGKPRWDADLSHWSYLGHVARANGLEWGGDWKKLRDMPHVQIPAKEKGAYKVAQAWLKAKGLA